MTNDLYFYEELYRVESFFNKFALNYKFFDPSNDHFQQETLPYLPYRISYHFILSNRFGRSKFQLEFGIIRKLELLRYSYEFKIF